MSKNFSDTASEVTLTDVASTYSKTTDTKKPSLLGRLQNAVSTSPSNAKTHSPSTSGTPSDPNKNWEARYFATR